MGEIKVSVPDEKEEKFRQAAMKVFGHKRGSISQAAERAFEEWADRVSEEEIDLSGRFGDFLLEKKVESDKSAVELQKELGDATENVLD